MITDVNPFVYSRPVAPEDVVDREDEVRRLLRDAVGGHYVRLYAPRKYGKTSLLKKALHDGERDEGLIPILVDLYRVSSIADVTVRLERAYAKQLKGELRSRIEAFLQRTGVGLSLGALGISARLQLEPASDPLPALHALLELPLRLESSGGYRALIAFDEFQDIGRIDGLDGLLRSHIQHHGEVASYVFAGSEPALMRLLFETKERPLYGSAVPMRLGRLADRDLADYVSLRFETTGRRAGEALGPLLARLGATHSARCCSRIGSGRRCPRVPRRRSTTGTPPTRPQCASSRRSSTPSGAGSTSLSRRPSARSSSETDRRTARPRCVGWN